MLWGRDFLKCNYYCSESLLHNDLAAIDDVEATTSLLHTHALHVVDALGLGVQRVDTTTPATVTLSLASLKPPISLAARTA